MSEPEATRAQRVGEVARLFLKLGMVCFGGPAAHVAIMEAEVVRRRQWLTHEEFLDLLGATNLIPGPNSTEMAIHIGQRRAGWLGLIVGGVCFILPAAMLVTLLAWAYVRFGKLPQTEGLLYGVKPVIIAVVLQALWKLGRAAVKTRALAVMGVVGAAVNWLGVNELIVLFTTGLLVAMSRGLWRSKASCVMPLLGAAVAPVGSGVAAGAAVAVAAPFSLGALFLFFLKVGAILFGSGYVLLAFLRADLVERWHWVTESQLLDAIAVGQITPGPLFTTATFIGYLLGGFGGGCVATVGIFLPAFVLVAISGPLIPRLRSSRVAGAFLDGVNVASLALMAVVTLRISADALVDKVTVGLAVLAAVLLLRYRVNSIWLVLGGAALGLARSAVMALHG
jgi:chromate transporter